MYNEEYYLPCRNDGTDMTAAIEERLLRYGTCLLGKGVYIVSGVNMPDGSSLIGMGHGSKLLLREEIPSGCAVKLGSFCTVRDLSVAGSESEITLPDGVGDRHGLAFLGTATPEDYADQPHNSIISGCFISGFNGAVLPAPIPDTKPGVQ